MPKYRILNVEMTGDAEFPRRITAERGGEFVVFESEEGGFFFERTGERFLGPAFVDFYNDLETHFLEVAMRENLARRAAECAARVKRFAEIRGRK